MNNSHDRQAAKYRPGAGDCRVAASASDLRAVRPGRCGVWCFHGVWGVGCVVSRGGDSAWRFGGVDWRWPGKWGGNVVAAGGSADKQCRGSAVGCCRHAAGGLSAGAGRVGVRSFGVGDCPARRRRRGPLGLRTGVAMRGGGRGLGADRKAPAGGLSPPATGGRGVGGDWSAGSVATSVVAAVLGRGAFAGGTTARRKIFRTVLRPGGLQPGATAACDGGPCHRRGAWNLKRSVSNR